MNWELGIQTRLDVRHTLLWPPLVSKDASAVSGSICGFFLLQFAGVQ